jgi:hypothetical protein
MFMKKMILAVLLSTASLVACGAPSKPSPSDGGKWGCYLQSNNLIISKHKTFDIAMAVCEEEEFKRQTDTYVMGPDKVKHPVNPDFTGVAVTAAGLPNGTVNQVYPTTSFTATGGKGPYTWAVASGSLPPGLRVDVNGALTGTPTTTVGSPWAFIMAATDTLGQVDTETFTITVLGPAPTVTTTTLPNVEEGSNYSQTLAATGGTPPLSWALASGNLPPGLSLSSAGVISGKVGLVAAQTTFSFVVRVTDLNARASTKDLSITVTNAPAVVATPATPPLGDVGVPYSFTVAATGGKTPYTFAVTGGALPTGLTMSSAGAITGTPTAAVSGTFTVTVTDNIGQTDTESYTITVRPAPPVVSTTTLPAASVGVPYNATITWTGGAGPYTVTVSAGSLPAGLTMSTAGVITGTPTTAGTANFTVTVRDANNKNGSKALSITVNPPALNITTTTLPGGTFGTAYNQSLQALGGTPPYTWTASAGLPPGITLSSAGVLSGTPGQPGEYSFSVTVRDASNATDTQALTIIVSNIPLEIVSPASLPAAEVNSTYLYMFVGQGGTPPYTWSFVSGDLPPGLTLGTDGKLSGTPTSNMLPQYVFTVSVTDGVETAQATVQIVVQNDTVPDADATLIWTPPTQYEDGSALPLEQIGGYRVYARPLGSTTWTYDIDIPDNKKNWYEFMELAPGVWEFSVRAYDTSAQISDFSNIATKEVLQ